MMVGENDTKNDNGDGVVNDVVAADEVPMRPTTLDYHQNNIGVNVHLVSICLLVLTG